jgi:dTDP-D-glucose 4,6-dehydratase
LRKTVEWYLKNIDWLNAIIREKDYQNWVQINYQGRNIA